MTEFFGPNAKMDFSDFDPDVDKTHVAPNVDDPSTVEFEKQKVWRTLSKTNGSGFFVWEVLQYMGMKSSNIILTPTRDHGFVLEMCYHFFSEDQAIAFLHNNEYSEYQTMTII